jgi:hypothetical protein
MSNYTKTTDFEAKDSLPTGDSGKIIRGSEFETEFDAISTAIATKADTAGPTFTGTLTFETISDGTIGVTAFVDEDDMSSDSATLVPTQQSVKAYVDAQVTAQDLDFQADSGGALSIDLDSETLTFTGGTGIDTSGSGNAVTFAIDSTVTTLTGTQTLTNKTLTTPVISSISNTGTLTLPTSTDTLVGRATTDTLTNKTLTSPVISTISNTGTITLPTSTDTLVGRATTDTLTNKTLTSAVLNTGVSGTAVLDEDNMASNSATQLATQQSIKAYVDSQVGANNELSEVLSNGNTTGGTDIAVGTGDDITFADSSKAIFGAGSDLQIYHDGFNSYIAESGTGDLIVRANNLQLQNGAGTQATIKTFNGGATELYYGGSKKLETQSTGINVTGTAVTDGLTVDGTATMTVSDNSNVLTLKSTDADENSGPRFALTRDSGSPADNDYVGLISFNADDDGGNVTRFSYMVTQIMDASNGSEDGALRFFTTTAGSEVETLSLVSGQVGIGTSSPAQTLHLKSADPVIRLEDSSPDGVYAQIDGAGGGLILSADGGNGSSSSFIGFRVDGTASGSEKMRIDSSGNVGIGTSSPAFVLDVNHASDNGLARFTSGDADAYITLSDVNSSSAYNKIGVITHDMYFNTNNTERMRIDSSGNVGIGTSSPDTLLELVGADPILTIRDSDTGSATANATLRLAETGASDTLGAYWDIKAVGGDLQFIDNWNEGGGTGTRLVIDDSGNVGIGTSSPTSFDAAGDNLVVGTGSGNNGITVYSGTANAGSLFFADGTGSAAAKADGYIQYTHSNQALAFATGGGSEAMRIDSSGNLLVGTTSTTANEGGLALIPQASNVSHMYIGHATGTATGNPYMYFRYGSSNIGSITQSGTTAVLYNTSSDQRLKENIVDAPSASDDIDAIQVRSFDWKADGSHQKYGMVAQELQSVAPEAVTGDADSDDMMGVDYSKLVPMMLKEIQSLRARVAQLEGEN